MFLNFIWVIPKVIEKTIRIMAITVLIPMKILLKTIFLIFLKRPFVTSIGEKDIARAAGIIPDTSPVTVPMINITGTERHVRPIGGISVGP